MRTSILSVQRAPVLAWVLTALHVDPCLQVLQRVAERGELVNVALNTHGTRAVQKLIETLSSREQRQIVIEALRDGGWERTAAAAARIAGACMGVR